MGKNTKIEWCDHTWNPWLGCTKISPGCAHCYAENLMDTRWKRVTWGRGNPRQRTSETNWRQPLVWDRAAKEAGERRKVFCASLADVFDPDERAEYLTDIRLAENITFVSAEPLLGDINLVSYLDYVDWVICGGESGPGARPIKKYWVQALQRQCRCHGIPFFVKQWGGVNKKAAGNLLDGMKWLEVPASDRGMQTSSAIPTARNAS